MALFKSKQVGCGTEGIHTCPAVACSGL